MNLANAKLDLDAFRQMTLRTLTMKKKAKQKNKFWEIYPQKCIKTSVHGATGGSEYTTRSYFGVQS